jgi:site-specific DNA-methyltransferase (adenine-specific)
MQELGYTEVPCVIIPAETPVEKLGAYTILDNNGFGKWDWDLLANEWSDWNMEDLGLDWEFAGFGEMDSNAEKESKQVEEDDFDEEKEKIPSRVSLGEIWLMGEHRLMCGDSTDIESVTKLMGGGKADMWLTDPPYNVALGYDGSASEARQRHRRTDGKKIMNDKMDDGAFRDFLIYAYKAAFANLKEGGAYYIWHADNESYNFRGALRDVGITLRQTLIWNKNAITLGRQDYQWKHEPCLYGWKDKGSHRWYSDRKQPTVIDFPRPTRSDEHPTMKPIPLFAYLIQNSSKEGESVLDTFGGSGTTLIACEQLNRKCYMMELDPHYCDVIIARWEKLTGKQAKKLQE